MSLPERENVRSVNAVKFSVPLVKLKQELTFPGAALLTRSRRWMAHLCAAVDEDLTGKKEEQVIESISSKLKCSSKGVIQFPAEEPMRLDLQM